MNTFPRIDLSPVAEARRSLDRMEFFLNRIVTTGPNQTPMSMVSLGADTLSVWIRVLKDLVELAETAPKLARALSAERAYHSNNSGENAAERKEAFADLPKKWSRVRRVESPHRVGRGSLRPSPRLTRREA